MEHTHSAVTHVDGMAFSVDVDGHTFLIDASAEHGGSDRGPRPKTLLLSALAGCTAMDVIAILRKMRQPVETFKVTAEADRTTDGHPSTLVDMVVTYEVTGAVDPDKLARAVELSETRYCGVSAMLAKHTTIRPRILLNGAEVATGWTAHYTVSVNPA